MDLLSIVCKNSSIALEYINSKKIKVVSSSRDLEMDYRLLKDKLEQLKYNKGTSNINQIGQMKRSIINPENSKERLKNFTFVKMADIKIASNKKDQPLTFNHSSQKSTGKHLCETPTKNRDKDYDIYPHGSGDKSKHYQ